MKIVLASDHRGYRMKKEVKEWLVSKGMDVVDLGCDSDSSVDYPDYSIPAAKKVANGEAELGLLFCNTGEGMVISSNKVRGVRAALVFKPEIGKFAKEHNGANVLCFPAGYISLDEVKEAVRGWINAEIKEERHIRRVRKIEEYEKEVEGGR